MILSAFTVIGIVFVALLVLGGIVWLRIKGNEHYINQHQEDV